MWLGLPHAMEASELGGLHGGSRAKVNKAKHGLEGVPGLPGAPQDEAVLCLQGVPDVPREPPDEAGLMRKFEK